MGGLATLFIPFSVSFLIALILSTLNLDIAWDANDWASVGLIFFVSLMYISCFFALGLFISSRVRTSSVSILTCLLIWSLFVLVIPHLAPYMAAWILPTPSSALMEKNIAELRNEMDKVKTLRFREVWRETGSEAKALEILMPFIQKVEKEYRGKIEQMQASFDRKAQRQLQITRWISAISPLSSFIYSGTELSGTGMHVQEYFGSVASAFRGTLNDYVEGVWRAAKKKNPEFSMETYIDIRGRPKFKFVEEGVGGRLEASYPYLLILLFFNVVFFMGSYLAFLRYDVR